MLWLFCRLAAAVPIQPLAWEFPCAASVALKRQTKQNKNKKKKDGRKKINKEGRGRRKARRKEERKSRKGRRKKERGNNFSLILMMSLTKKITVKCLVEN